MNLCEAILGFDIFVPLAFPSALPLCACRRGTHSPWVNIADPRYQSHVRTQRLALAFAALDRAEWRRAGG